MNRITSVEENPAKRIGVGLHRCGNVGKRLTYKTAYEREETCAYSAETKSQSVEN